MPNCAIINCKNSSKNINRGNGDVSYHRFPKDPSIRDKWINTTGRPGWFPKKSSTLCSEHFDKKYFFIKTSGNKFLRDTAVPEKKIVCFQFDVSKRKGHDETKSESEISGQINEPEIDSDEECLVNIREKARIEANAKNSTFTNNEQRLVQLLRWNEDKVKKQNMEIKQLLAKNRRLKIKIDNILGGESGDTQQDCRIGLAKARKDSSSDQQENVDNIYHEIENETYLQTKINKIKDNSKAEFVTFGCTVAEYLNSISLKPAVILQTRLEAMINKFKVDLKKSNLRNVDQGIKPTRHNRKRTSKENAIHIANNTNQSLLDSTNSTFSRTINRLAHIDDVNLSIDNQIIKVNSSTEQFIAYCIQPRLSRKSNTVTVVENADDLLEPDKNREENKITGTIHELEVKIEENDVIVKLEDETLEQAYNDPLNTG